MRTLFIILALLIAPSLRAEQSTGAASIETLQKQVKNLQSEVDRLSDEIRKINRNTTYFGPSLDDAGYIRFDSNRGAEIYLEGQFIGNAPLTYAVTKGKYKVSMVDPMSRREIAREVTVGDGSTVVFEQDF